MSERVIKFRARVMAKTPDPTGKYFRAKKGDWMFFALKDLLVESRLGRFPAIDWSTLGQFTELHDKNGKQIYEGDIVKYETSYEREDDNRSGICEVEWIERYSGFYPFVLNNRWRCDVGNVEIIGDIHSNPELLTQTQVGGE